MKKLFATATVCAAMLAAPSVAHAEYVCTTGYVPGASTLGQDGYVYAFWTSSPGCSGNWEGVKYYCSPGATSSNCAASAYYQYPLEGLMGLYDAFVEAISDATYGFPLESTCIGGGSGCGSYVQFDAT